MKKPQPPTSFAFSNKQKKKVLQEKRLAKRQEVALQKQKPKPAPVLPPKIRNFRTAVDMIFANKPISIDRADTELSAIKSFKEGIWGYIPAYESEKYKNIILHLEKQKVSFNKEFVQVLLNAFRKEQWIIRPITEWKNPTHNSARQINSLLRHLFAKYPVPKFLDSSWIAEGNTHHSHFAKDWFIHIGGGNNIRTACGLPIPLTKKMAHHFLEAPNECKPKEAIRWGEIKAMGGDERLIRAIWATRLGENFAQNDFWITVIKWFMDNPMLDTNQYGPIIDYIAHARNEQPNFCMKNRQADTLLRAVDHWHAQLRREQRNNRVVTYQYNQDYNWKASLQYTAFEYEEGKNNDKVIWRIKELLNSAQLKEEGIALHHCVASYGYSCASGTCTIWSLTSTNQGQKRNEVTIEIRGGAIAQARGLCNAKPTPKQKIIIDRWASLQGLSWSRWL